MSKFSRDSVKLVEKTIWKVDMTMFIDEKSIKKICKNVRCYQKVNYVAVEKLHRN